VINAAGVSKMNDLKKLIKFLVKAKKQTYASINKMKIESERPLHDELEFSEGDLYYRDSYVGFFQAPGMEEVRLGKNGRTIWAMAYSGGMSPEFQNNVDFAKQVFSFLKKALNLVDEGIPYRGPSRLKEKDWEYINEIKGDIKRFIGHERILFKNKEVFSQDYFGGLVIEK
jgi:hypothetical protein